MLRNLRHLLRLQKLLIAPTCNLVNTIRLIVPAAITVNSRAAALHTSQALQKYDKKSSRSAQDVDSDDEEDAEFKDERDSKVIKTNVNSLRADALLKSGLGMARK